MKYGKIEQKKSLGQVFLKVKWPLERICEIVRDFDGKSVLEIGPGGGVLTRELITAGFKVTAVEKDDRFAAERLSQDVPNSGGLLEICNEDILKFDLGRWLDKNSSESAVVVGNVPYNISTPILEWLIPSLGRLSGACLMVQFEFAKRLCAKSGTKDYGSLSVFAQLRSELSLDFEVNKECFRPVPKVDSAVISIRPKIHLPCDEELLLKIEFVTKSAFSQRRKKLSNSISALLIDRKVDVSKCPIDLTLRPDHLSPLEYVELTRFLYR